MQRMITAVCLLTTTLGGAASLAKQTRRHVAGSKRAGLEMANIRPDLAVDADSVTKFKLASRKTKYRFGEVITVDLAVMNASEKPVFMRDPRTTEVVFNAVDVDGKKVSVGIYELILHGPTIDSYRSADPGVAIFTNFYFLAGYDSQASTIFEEKRRLGRNEARDGPASYFKTLFERDLFINLGDAYLDAKSAGAFTITAEFENDLVVVSPDNPKMRTATGKIVSSPLTISISD